MESQGNIPVELYALERAREFEEAQRMRYNNKKNKHRWSIDRSAEALNLGQFYQYR